MQLVVERANLPALLQKEAVVVAVVVAAVAADLGVVPGPGARASNQLNLIT
jgi:hypothetical protein